ncbi:carboxy-S-adenosyl-L-methionine synthase CmoA [Lelliottia sp. V106_10]|uniref:carboxy-S-adenosyl-L-methionine synthase CmoA n=1 Tax=Lelliottia wanjuensis TaxID=3050585 RepID=UPI002550B8D3|nr:MULTISPECIES: carboxy-S-adenosyl-L-methionine synthase CmoA [unclassified Lelliottia]MDK9354847.1 carboxy-S-adenosyl-L-methionine synthase CmoA [Lelliottia sp. V106_16]MDK9372054.1 carboxy-S-adenosyl-L-methionine synthase CmoA [Lelliottia sp. V106_10]MDK9598691.1 carboxy-S-adenosyl-L-methionine synthase CmoA [Lelliottia sp. V106_5]
MTLDTVFAQEKAAEDFRFDEQVAGVFDDMVDRSVPFYQEIQRMVSELTADYAIPGSQLCDLGCATGTTLALMDSVVSPDVGFIGVDNSPEMLEKCRAKFEQLQSGRTSRFLCQDLREMALPENLSVVSMLLTLMFVRPVYRRDVLSAIYQRLNPGGALILVEKVVCDSPDLNRQFIKYYYDMKRRHGYSELEISQKREALENVLIPYTESENRQILADAGFSRVEAFFRWYNFCGMVAVK